jgi:hypothetical protein
MIWLSRVAASTPLDLVYEDNVVLVPARVAQSGTSGELPFPPRLARHNVLVQRRSA